MSDEEKKETPEERKAAIVAENRKATDLVRDLAQVAIQHFDSVQVFGTRHTKYGTVRAAWGEGNYYARVGQISFWLGAEEAVDTQAIVIDTFGDPPPESPIE